MYHSPKLFLWLIGSGVVITIVVALVALVVYGYRRLGPAVKSPRSNAQRTKRVLFILFAFVIVAVLYVEIPLSGARPPKDLKTIAQFLAWKSGAITGRGTFKNGSAAYTVFMGPAGRYLSSGPAAYLFDNHGQFVDWTADMGDFHTVNSNFDLTASVKNLKNE